MELRSSRSQAETVTTRVSGVLHLLNTTEIDLPHVSIAQTVERRAVWLIFKTKNRWLTFVNLLQILGVLIENFKVGGLKKFDLNYATLQKLYPRLIYCSVTGFGQDSPYARRAGYDMLIQGMSGIMDLTGDPEGEP